MNLINPQQGAEIISVLLVGSQLDSIRAYSVIVQLGFVRLGSDDGLPNEIWISISGKLCDQADVSGTEGATAAEDFFGLRAAVLGSAYLMVGQKVTAAKVLASGMLQIEIGGKYFSAEADGTNLEEVWSVMSDSPDASADHRWYVALEDSGALYARLPP